MQHEKINFYASEYTSKTKEEAVNQSPIFKAQLRDKLLRAKLVTANGLLNFMLNGHTVNFGSVRNKNLMALDIDNEGQTKITDANQLLEILADVSVYPTYVLETVSSTLNNPRFRIILALDKGITNTSNYIDNIKALVKYINQLYPDSADPKCCDSLSLFYPCKECLYRSPESRTCTEALDRLTTVLLPDRTVSLNLAKFFAPILYNANLMTQTEYEHYSSCTTPITFFWRQKRCLYNIPECYNTHLKKSMNYIGKRNIDSQSLNNVFKNLYDLRDGIQSVFEQSRTYDFDITKSIVEENISNLFILDDKKEHKNILFENAKMKIIFSKDHKKLLTVDKSTDKIVKNFSAIDYFAELFSLSSFKDTMDFIRKICNLTYKDKHLRSYKTNLSHYLNALDEQLPKYKYLNEILCYKDNYITKFILSTLVNIAHYRCDLIKEKMPYEYTGEVQLFANALNIIGSMKEYYPGKEVSAASVKTKVILLEKLGLIKYVPPEEINAYISNTITRIRRHTLLNKQSSAITIPKYSVELLREADKKAKELLSKGNSTLAAAYVRNAETIYNSPYFIEADKFIKAYFAPDVLYMPQPELSHFYRDKMKSKSPDAIVSKYKPFLIKENKLKVVLLTKQLMRKFKITKEIAKQKRYRLGYTSILIKED